MNSAVLDASRKQLYARHLELVSRSFAVCIARLEDPARTYIGMTYLICRVLDSIEDSIWGSKQDQAEALRLLAQVFEDADRTLPGISSSYLSVRGLTDAEGALLKDLPLLIEDFRKLPDPVQDVISRLVSCMSRGMEHYLQRRMDAELRIHSLVDLNRYCYFVAGVVGEALTSLIALVDPEMQTNQVTMERAQHFGLFLQKVNVLKDQKKDQSEGRHFVSDRIQVIASLRENGEQAWRYIQCLPKSQQPYKVFCLWSFLLGLKTVPLLLESEGEEVKLPRSEATQLFMEIEKNIQDASALEMLFENSFKYIKWPEANQHVDSRNDQETEWFLENRSAVDGDFVLETAALQRLNLL